jgi:hypothetical protein
MSIHPKLRKIVAAVAREQGGNVVHLADVETDVRGAIMLNAIDAVWELFGAGLIEADLAEEMLQHIERKLDDEFVQRTIFGTAAERAERHAQLAAHRAARGVRKVRGAK